MRHLFWQPKTSLGLESLTFQEAAFLVDSVVLGIEDGESFRLHYRIWLDQNWQAKSLKITHLPYGEEHSFFRDGDDRWTRGDFLGDDAGQWFGCTDLDISCTPFTNTLPIRRLNLEIGQSADIQVLFVECPRLRVSTAQQRYERLSEFEYRFTGLESNFTAVIMVDSDGFVTDYPGLFERRYA